MTNESSRSSDPVDPLQGYTGLAVFPNTFKVLPDPSKPFDLNLDLELQDIRNHLKSMALLHSPSKLKDQVKNIVSSASEIMNSDTTQALKHKTEVVPAKAVENPRERRPALGRKRARFSLKPNSSQPAMSLKPTLDIKKLKDPEEFFMAYERHENAKKEIEKQMGGAALDANQHNPSSITRHRRPGILGRSAKYKHLYSSLKPENSENVISSQEMFETSSLSPLNHSSQKESNENVALEEMDLAGSIAKDVNKMNEFLDQLLSQNSEDLEGDGAVNLLQEGLQIKPFELGKLCLPEFQDIRKVDFKSLRGTLSKPTRVLTDIDNLIKGRSSRTPAKQGQGADRSIHLASPTPPKSPLASLSLLIKRKLQSSSSSDPFSTHDIDQLLVANPSSAENSNKQSDLVDVGEKMTFSDELKSSLIEQNGNIEVAKSVSPGVAIDEFGHAFERAASDNSSKLGVGIDVGSSRSDVDMEDIIGDSYMDDRVMDDTLSRPDVDADTWENGANNGDKVEDKLQQEAVACVEPELNVVDSTLEKLNGAQSQLADQLQSVALEEHQMGGLSRNPDTGPEKHNEIMQEHSKVSKEVSRPRKKQKSKVSKRQSLAGDGTMWKSGVRRSTRMKTRPLEYWKGERLLYGRIHESLATVIGMKYASPGKGEEKATLKVKSFVSDEYKELVDLAALH